jgi:hypothetical protein
MTKYMYINFGRSILKIINGVNLKVIAPLYHDITE